MKKGLIFVLTSTLLLTALTSCGIFKRSRYVNMSPEELSSLSDEKLLEAVVARIEKKMDKYGEPQCPRFNLGSNGEYKIRLSPKAEVTALYFLPLTSNL